MNAYGKSIVDKSIETERVFMKSVSELINTRPKRQVQDILVDIVVAHRADLVAQRRAAVLKSMRTGLVQYMKIAALDGEELVDVLDKMMSPMLTCDTSAEAAKKDLLEMKTKMEREAEEPVQRRSKRARRG